MIYATPFGDVSVPIMPEPRTIGISASGGADSTILLYCMALQQQQPRVFFLENANSKLSALESVVAYINRRFPVDLKIEICHRLGAGNNIRPDIMDLSARVDYLYTGVTKNPPVEIGGLAPNRPRGTAPANFIMPFLNLDKRASLHLFHSLGVVDLLALTYTCTQNPEVPCSECFACREKAWATEGLCL